MTDNFEKKQMEYQARLARIMEMLSLQQVMKHYEICTKNSKNGMVDRVGRDILFAHLKGTVIKNGCGLVVL